MNYEDHPSTKTNDAYQDRAAERRRTVGSDCPSDRTTATQPASVHWYSSSSSSSSNVGSGGSGNEWQQYVLLRVIM